MTITFKDDVKKKITKSDLPSNIQSRKIDIQFELKHHLNMKIGAVVKANKPIECHSIIGEQMGVDVPVLIPKDSPVLFAGIRYCNILKHMMLELVYKERLIYFDYDKNSVPGNQKLVLEENFEVLIKGKINYGV